MKKEKNKNFTKLTHKKGISLIILIVTIIVIIILAAVVILTISKNNPIESAKEAKFKEDVRSFQDDLSLTISKDYTANGGQRDYKFNATTLSEMQNYIPSFTNEYEGKVVIKNDELMYQETVTEKEKKWFEELGIKENIKLAAEAVAEDPDKYYGQFVTNYETGDSEIDSNMKWKIFHSDENNVYLIANDYVPVSTLPTTSKGNKPENSDTTYPNAAPFKNVIADYSGSEDIKDSRIQALNSDYFNKGYTSTDDNMKAVAYMLDINIWNKFAGRNTEYAIGGPTVEMLMASYRKSHKLDCRAQASSKIGYKISEDGGATWGDSIHLSTSDSLYIITSNTKAMAMWLASPSDVGMLEISLIDVDYTGGVYHNYCTNTGIGFRPIVCLKSDVILKSVDGGYEIQ